MEKFVKVLLKFVNVKGIALYLINDIIEAALKKVVASSENKFDDMAMASLWPILESEVVKLIEEKLEELEKLEEK